MRKCLRMAIIVILAPVAVLTFKWWGMDYYRHVIN